MLEYEAKVKIKNKRAVVLKLKKLKAKDLGLKKEVDIYLAQGVKGVRVRKLGKDGIITFKSLVQSRVKAKVRDEIQAQVSGIDSLIDIFKHLGFTEQKRKEKIRHTFKLADAFVLVDRIPFLGCFIEIEGKSGPVLKKTALRLGLDYKQASFASYEDLFFAYYIKNAKD